MQLGSNFEAERFFFKILIYAGVVYQRFQRGQQSLLINGDKNE